MEMCSVAVTLVVALICHGTNVESTTGRVASLRQVLQERLESVTSTLSDCHMQKEVEIGQNTLLDPLSKVTLSVYN
jgi:hypothetical protein